MEQIDMFSLLSGGERKALSFDELAYMTGRRIELVFRTSQREWSLFGCVVRVESRRDSTSGQRPDRDGRLRTQEVRKSPAATALVESKIQAGRLRIKDSSAAPRIQRDGNRQVLVYETDDAGYGLINEYEFSDALAYPVRAYEVI